MRERTGKVAKVAKDLKSQAYGRGGGGGGCSPPKILGNLDFLGSKRNLGKANYLRCFQAVF